MSADEELRRRDYDGLAAAVASTQHRAASIVVQLNSLRNSHLPHDLDYDDAVKAYHRAAKELRDLARIAELWGGQK